MSKGSNKNNGNDVGLNNRNAEQFCCYLCTFHIVNKVKQSGIIVALNLRFKQFIHSLSSAG